MRRNMRLSEFTKGLAHAGPAAAVTGHVAVHCPDCGYSAAHVVNQQGEVLLHRGVADYGDMKDYNGQPYKSAEHMMGEEGPGGDLHEEYGHWWGSPAHSQLYGGDSGNYGRGNSRDGGMRVSAWFPSHELTDAGEEHEGHYIRSGVRGRVQSVEVWNSKQWKALPHSPGFHVQTGRTD